MGTSAARHAVGRIGRSGGEETAARGDWPVAGRCARPIVEVRSGCRGGHKALAGEYRMTFETETLGFRILGAEARCSTRGLRAGETRTTLGRLHDPGWSDRRRTF